MDFGGHQETATMVKMGRRVPETPQAGRFRHIAALLLFGQTPEHMPCEPERAVTSPATDGLGSMFSESASPTTGVAQALSPRNMLHENEIVILMVRPSVWYIFVTSSTFIAVVIALALLSETSQTVDRIISLPTMATITGILVFCGLLYGVMEWIGHHYILTNCRLITIQGLLQPQISQTVLGRITDISLGQSIPQKLLHAGTMEFTFEAERMPNATWQWIRSPQRVEQQIRQAISRYRGKMGP